MSLDQKVALVTGAGQGIGLEIARTLGQKGMIVAMCARSEKVEQAAAVLKTEGLQVLAIRADITQKTQVEAMMAQVEAELGPLWLLVNNAGALTYGPTAEMSEADWDVCFNVDAKGVFLCSQAAIRRMMPRRVGRIVNLSSIAGEIVRVEQIAYCSAKAAVNHFTRCLAVEMAPHGITVNAVCPGMTWTAMLAESAAVRNLDLEAMVALIPAGKMADGADHAHMVTFLASEEAKHTTGQIISVDGGQSDFHPLMAQRVG
ncbi:MAG: SDR family oxidoreductase [Caldilineaceae bacterium]|nr:SDR family oxidoreductase [Caldilineaceae bacterium]MBP8110481.1 SDR family oxidoreductase [Caldilineaceae bacterium]MBP8125576.1 SDR family oxidoreductase [Caldilineaceae bacterium]